MVLICVCVSVWVWVHKEGKEVVRRNWSSTPVTFTFWFLSKKSHISAEKKKRRTIITHQQHQLFFFCKTTCFFSAVWSRAALTCVIFSVPIKPCFSKWSARFRKVRLSRYWQLLRMISRRCSYTHHTDKHTSALMLIMWTFSFYKFKRKTSQ